jgi:site-specific recombinase XerD
MDIETYSRNFNTYLFRLGYAESTIKHNSNDIKLFLKHLQEQKITALKQVKPEHIHVYNDYLHRLKSRLTGVGLNGKTIQSKINNVRLFSQFTEATEKIKIYSTKVEIIPSIKNHKEIISQEQIKNIYNQTDDSVKGMRDRAILGLYYGCGLRYKEGIKVEINHIDYKKELLFISPSKNYHSRYVPINQQVLKDFKEYESYARAAFRRSSFKQRGNCFLSGSVSNGFLNKTLQNLCDKASIEKRLCLHGLRHSIATHLLQKEMPIEQIAKFLGHRTIRATQIYTHIVEELKHEKQ